jgi:hypothetical protein
VGIDLINTSFNINRCQINLTQVVSDQNEKHAQIPGWQYKHQASLMVDLEHTPLQIKILPESSFGRIVVSINEMVFHTDNPTLLNQLFDLSQLCLGDPQILEAAYLKFNEKYNYLSFCRSENDDQNPSQQWKKIKLKEWGDLGPKVSVISSTEKLQEIFQDSINKSMVPYLYAHDQCFSRSLMLGKYLADQGIECGQIFVFAPFTKYLKVANPLDDESIMFSFHVAPFILDGEKSNSLAIFDPTLNSLKPLTQDEWVSIMTKHEPGLILGQQLKFEIRNRFAYGSAGISQLPMSAYRPEDLTLAEAEMVAMRNFLYLLTQMK